MKFFIINIVSPQQEIGGAEIQCWLITKYLAKLGHNTAYLAAHSLNEKLEEQDEGLPIYYLKKKNENKFKIFIRFYKLLKKEKPELCYIRVFKYAFFLNLICHWLKIPTVFNTSHIHNCQPNLVKIKWSLNFLKTLKSIKSSVLRHLNFYALKKVDFVVTLNEDHSQLLKTKYNIEAMPIYNSMEDNYDKYKKPKHKQVVWTNNIKERKRPELFIKLANEFKNSDYKFLMIGYLQNNVDYYQKIIKECEEQNNNFKYLGGMKKEEVDNILAESQIYVNTCLPEGFGNGFIQAWFNKCPTVTLSFDADDIIVKNKIGFHSKSFEQMVQDVKKLINDDKLRQETGDKARKYALQNHSIFTNIKKYEQVFKRVINETLKS